MGPHLHWSQKSSPTSGLKALQFMTSATRSRRRGGDSAVSKLLEMLISLPPYTLLHLHFEKACFGTADILCIVAVLMVEGVAACVQATDLLLALLFIVAVLRQAA